VAEPTQKGAYFRTGDQIKIVIPKNEIFIDEIIVLMVMGFNYYCLADGGGSSGGHHSAGSRRAVPELRYGT
jgi:hypothetical protein